MGGVVSQRKIRCGYQKNGGRWQGRQMPLIPMPVPFSVTHSLTPHNKGLIRASHPTSSNLPGVFWVIPAFLFHWNPLRPHTHRRENEEVPLLGRGGDTYKTPPAPQAHASAHKLLIYHFTVKAKGAIFWAYVILQGQRRRYFLTHKFLFVNAYLLPI